MDAQTGKFRDIAELGKGGMGEVFLTLAPGPSGFNKLLVVKRLRPSLAGDPEFLRMFLNEARLAARLNHPNIVHTYDVGFDGSCHYITMEYLEGQSLQRLLRRAVITGGLPLDMQLRVLADALAGLHHAHELTDYDGTPLAIIHRDVSPANIFILYDGQVKLVDFGIAKSADSTETQAGIFKGKIQYVSPEQYTGGALDRRADIYSTGVVLWEAATQRRMWQDIGDLSVMQRVAAGDIPRPGSVNPQVPKQLEAICLRALAVCKNDRYPTAAALQADLEEFLQERGSRVSAREVGVLTAKTFADDRAHLKILIEDQLRLVRDYPDPQSLVPTVTVQQDTGSRSTALESNFFPAFAPPRTRRRNVAIALGASVAVTIAGLALLSPSSPEGPRARANKSPVPAVTALPAAPAEPVTLPVAPPLAAPQIKLTVETSPKGARVMVDEALLPLNGQLTGFARDNALHKVRAEAQGFRAKTEWIRFDSDDITVEISLEPSARKGRKETRGNKEAAAQSVLVEPPFPSSIAPPTQPPAPVPMREIDLPSVRRPSTPPPLDSADPWKK